MYPCDPGSDDPHLRLGRAGMLLSDEAGDIHFLVPDRDKPLGLPLVCLLSGFQNGESCLFCSVASIHPLQTPQWQTWQEVWLALAWALTDLATLQFPCV